MDSQTPAPAPEQPAPAGDPAALAPEPAPAPDAAPVTEAPAADPTPAAGPAPQAAPSPTPEATQDPQAAPAVEQAPPTASSPEAAPAPAAAPPVTVDQFTKRDDSDVQIGHAVQVTDGEHAGQTAVYLSPVNHDPETGYPVEILIRFKDTTYSAAQAVVPVASVQPAPHPGSQ